jgi:hypothetical protein
MIKIMSRLGWVEKKGLLHNVTELQSATGVEF